MKSEEKIQCFKSELNYIKNEQIREFTTQMIGKLPDYFFEVSASSTNKFHPAFAREAGGLVLHVRAAVRFAQEMLRCPMFGDRYSDIEKDMITSALILHDGVKSGIIQQKYSIATHPLEMVTFCKQQDDIKEILDQESFNKIMSLIETHMGCYTQDYRSGKDVLPYPQKAIQKFVFMCDYVVSRPCVTHDFDVPLSSK